jgi:hypothetical protein
MSLSTPSQIQERLEGIEQDLASKQNAWEDASMKWFVAKRDREKALAVKFLSANGTVAERKAEADRWHATDGAEAEALYEALKAVVRTLETRATIGMALLKSQGRA